MKAAQDQTFSAALDAVKTGRRIARQGWNGKGMFVFLNKGAHRAGPEHGGPEEAWPRLIGGVSADLFEKGDFGIVTRLPNLNMKSATGAVVTGWLASQTDLLADDWCILD